MVAIAVVSLSELKKVHPEITSEYLKENKSKLLQYLWELGGDIQKPFECQENLLHRNRLNEVVQCDRWVLTERLDKEWIDSGYCSREAKNESSGSQMVKDLDPYKYHKL
jgi:hypothetical protein